MISQSKSERLNRTPFAARLLKPVVMFPSDSNCHLCCRMKCACGMKWFNSLIIVEVYECFVNKSLGVL